MSDLWKRQKGSVLVLVALGMVVVIGFAALAVDGGYLYYRHTQLQDIADAVALAAAMEYVSNSGDSEKAIAKAKEYAQENGLTLASEPGEHTAAFTNAANEPGNMDISFPNSGTVLVNLSLSAHLYFAKVFGNDFTDLGVSAKAGGQNSTGYGTGLYPVGALDQDFQPGQTYALNYGPPGAYAKNDSTQGNFCYVNIDAYVPPGETPDDVDLERGKKNFRSYLVNGYTGSTIFFVNGQLYTLTGVGIGNSEIQSGKTIVVPLLNNLDVNGSKLVTILGFAEFRITAASFEHGSLTVISGVFIRRIDSGPSGGGSLLQTVKLIS